MTNQSSCGTTWEDLQPSQPRAISCNAFKPFIAPIIDNQSH